MKLRKTIYNLLLENVQSQKDIEQFANDILKHLVEKYKDTLTYLYDYIVNHILDMNIDILFAYIHNYSNESPVNYLVLNNKKKYSKEFVETIQSSKDLFIYIRNKEASKYVNTSGQYNNYSNVITIFVDYVPFKKELDYYIDRISDDNKNLTEQLLEPIIKEGIIKLIMDYLFLERDIKGIKKVLVHELQHWYDNIRSSEKNLDNNFIQAMQKYEEGKLDDYLKLSHEISARYTETISNIDKYVSWKEYKYNFINEFNGWHLMSDDIKKRLLKRLYVEYMADKKVTIDNVDITNIIKNLNDKYNNKFKDLYIHYQHSENLIYITSLKTENYSAAHNLFRDLIKVADTYRKTTATFNPEWIKKPYREILQGVLRYFDFFKNSGRKKDYRYSESFLRYPKRK